MSEDNPAEWQAAQWVAQRMGDQPFDKPAFDAWIARDPRHQPLFDTMWTRIMGPNMDGALGAYGQRRQARRVWLAGSAAAMLALVGGYEVLPSAELFMAAPQDYAAADGTIRTVALEDGTRLMLAGGAAVRVRYTGHDRTVELTRGTMFADVRHDAARPFRIDAGDARITDLGTRFEVSRKPAMVRVAVESGSVGFGTHGWFAKPIALTADQGAILTGTGVSRIDHAGRTGIARWRSEWIEYHDAPMRQVIGDLESVSPLPIRIEGTALADRRVSGRIRLIDPPRQISNLAIIHDFAVDRRGDAIILSPK